jgi:hypothetical protein
MDDLVDAPFIDDDERAESEWLLARDHDPAAQAPSSMLASDYAELEGLLGNLPAGVADESWHEDVLRAAVSSAPASRP